MIGVNFSANRSLDPENSDRRLISSCFKASRSVAHEESHTTGQPRLMGENTDQLECKAAEHRTQHKNAAMKHCSISDASDQNEKVTPVPM